jgi:hypothetical protein
MLQRLINWFFDLLTFECYDCGNRKSIIEEGIGKGQCSDCFYQEVADDWMDEDEEEAIMESLRIEHRASTMAKEIKLALRDPELRKEIGDIVREIRERELDLAA